jgi:uroporphyrinogen III methyltransferase/synthase
MSIKPTVVITRPSGPYAGAQKLASRLALHGFEPFEFPVLSCEALPLSDDARAVVQTTIEGKGSWIAFLSPTAVHVFHDLIRRAFPSSASLEGLLLASQGKGTAEAIVECFGRKPDFVPSVFVAEEFAREFAPKIRSGQRVLVPQSADGRDLLGPALRVMGKDAHSFSLYALVPLSADADRIRALGDLPSETTIVVFMSPSAVRAAVQQAGATLANKRVLSIGPITSQAVRKAGLTLWREAREHSEDGVLLALLAN